MNLYVWTEFCPDYYDGLAVAVAETEEEAKEQVQNIFYLTEEEDITWGDLHVIPLAEVDTPFAYAVVGGS